jgi:hypothetical protein
MEYGTLGRTNLKVSRISLGTEYLLETSPKLSEDVIRASFEAGINYYDLFYAQAHFRDKMGKVFQPIRKDVLLAAHYGAGEKDGQYQRIRNMERMEYYFHDFLQRYQTDYVDVLFFHNCDDQDDFERMSAPGGMLDKILGYQKEGKARFIGFSAHRISVARSAVETGLFDVLMFPINPMVHETEGMAELYDICRKNGTAIVAMKIYAGGKLVGQNFSLSNLDRLRSYNRAGAGSKAIKCISYALDRPQVEAVLPGCGCVEHVRNALDYLQADDETKDYSFLVETYAHSQKGECVYCNHCLPCPVHIDIGAALRVEDDLIHELDDFAENVADCTSCGACTPRCPFDVDPAVRITAIRDKLRGR